MTTRTGTILDRIAAQTAEDVAERRARTPLAKLESQVVGLPAVVPFVPALRRQRIGVIAEIKRASPSKGAIAADIDARAVATDYLAGGASAISVLTDEPFFQGSLADLSAVAELAHLHDPQTPVLRKDFVIDPYQVTEARVAGADVVLLIVALLRGSALRELLAVVHEAGLAALVEVHTEDELAEAIDAGAEVIGINNRDLRTFQVDLGTTERLAPMIPTDRTIVAESGIHSAADVQRLAAAGAQAMLIGESLMLADDRRAMLRGLLA